jgi:uncharacterized protein YdeI (YjbR/CyaY-like superfamily)
MGARDPRVDAYIAKSPDFAKPILTHLRAVVHAACPEVEEAIKWGMPFFMYNGAMLCNMAAFKQHCAFGFWRGTRVVADGAQDGAMGQFGRITALTDLPSKKVLTGYIERAMALHDDGGPSRPRAKPRARKAVAIPEELRTALRKSPAARAAFERFSPSQKREYAEWIAEAKREETRERRLETAIAWIAEGKPRNWKYMKS